VEKNLYLCESFNNNIIVITEEKKLKLMITKRENISLYTYRQNSATLANEVVG